MKVAPLFSEGIVKSKTSLKPATFFLKCLFAGSDWDHEYKLNGFPCTDFKKSLQAFKVFAGLNYSDNILFGEQELNYLAEVYHMDLRCVLNTIVTCPDMAIQPDGTMLIWPKENKKGIAFFSPYLDYSGVHDGLSVISQGPMSLATKLLFAFTPFWQMDEYVFDAQFCRGLANTVKTMQRRKGLDVDGCFGVDTKGEFGHVLNRKLMRINRSVLG